MTQERKSSTERKQQIFRFVRDRLLAGEPPSIREVQQAFDFRAVQSARDYLEALVADGMLEKAQGKARGYRLPEGGEWPTRMVPLLGAVQAGQLSTAIEDPDGFVAVQSNNQRNDLFALKVRGESMRDAAILSDDVVIVQRQQSANHGEIVVAMVDDEATVKRLWRRDGCIELRPENPAFSSIAPDPEHLQILGKVIEVRRSL